MKLFDEIGNEENVIPAVAEDTGVNTMVIGDVLSIEAAETDMNECAAEILAIEGAVESGRDTMTTVEAQIAVEEGILAKPENVAASTVTLSYESMKMTANILGYNVDALEISAEAMEKSPATALEISVEEKKNFVKDIIEKIKKALATIWKKIKEFAAKAMLVFSGLEKKAKALQTEIKDLKGDAPKELSEALVKKIKARNAAHYILGGKTTDTLDASSRAVNRMSVMYNDIAKAMETANGAVTVNKTTNADAIKKLIEDINGAVKTANISKLNSNDKKAVFTVDGSTFFAVECVAGEVKEEYSKEAAVAAINGIDIKVTTVSTKDAKFDVKPASQKELADMISTVVIYASKVKDFGKSIDALTKNIDDKTSKLKGDSVTDRVLAKTSQVFGTGITGKLISGHLANVKNTMLLVNDLKNTFVVKSNEDIEAAQAVVDAGEAAPSVEDLEAATATVAANTAKPSVEDLEAAQATITAAGTAGEATPSVEDIDAAKLVIAASEAAPSVEDFEAATAVVALGEAVPSVEEIAAAKVVIGTPAEDAE